MSLKLNKHFIKRICYFLLAAVGLLIVFYPNISNAWNDYRTGQLMSEYTAAEMSLEVSEKEKILQAARTYNSKLSGRQVPDTFLEHEHVPDYLYESQLNLLHDGIMGEIEIPCIKIRIPIYHYTDEETLKKGAGHLPGSALPVGGRGTHSVISAHRGLTDKKLFTDLDRLRKGNLFYIHVLGSTLAYEVDHISVVEPRDTGKLAAEQDRDFITLLTCTPYGVNSHRLLVRGTRIGFNPDQYSEEQLHQAPPARTSVIRRLFCVGIGFLIAVLLNRMFGFFSGKFLNKAN